MKRRRCPLLPKYFLLLNNLSYKNFLGFSFLSDLKLRVLFIGFVLIWIS